MMLRVRRAAATSIAARLSCSGTMSSRSLSVLSHRTPTPIDSSTSRIRFTSSMRATLRSTVVPSLSSAAHRRATPAFLLDFTSMLPDNVVPPCTRRWLGPADGPTLTLTRSESSAEPMRASMSSVRFWAPFSMRLIALWLVFSRSASCNCVMPLCWRASRMRLPMRAR